MHFQNQYQFVCQAVRSCNINTNFIILYVIANKPFKNTLVEQTRLTS